MSLWNRFWNRFSSIPSANRKKVSDIDLDYWKNRGIRLILIDCDNTICKYREEGIPKEIANWVKKAKKKGFKIVIISNNKKSRVRQVAKDLDVGYIALAFKFLIFRLKLEIKKNKVSPKQTLVIGDQKLMDIIPGNIIGTYTILVNPLSEKDAFLTKIISRKLEKLFLKEQF